MPYPINVFDPECLIKITFAGQPSNDRSCDKKDVCNDYSHVEELVFWIFVIVAGIGFSISLPTTAY